MMTPLDHPTNIWRAVTRNLAGCGTFSNERGAALLLVMIVVSLLTTLILYFDHMSRVYLRAAQTTRDEMQLRHLAEGGIAIAMAILHEDMERSPGTDHLKEAWALPLPIITLDTAKIALHIEDEAGKLNLNQLIGAKGLPVAERITQAQRLFTLLRVNPGIVEAIADWIDLDEIPQPLGAETREYQFRRPPDRAANRPLTSLAELHRVAGMTPDTYQRLVPYVTVYGTSSPLININTASPLVLQALDTRLTSEMAARITQTRPVLSTTQMDAIPSMGPLAQDLRNRPADGFGVTLRSTTFRATTRVTLNQRSYQLSAILARRGGQVQIVRYETQIPLPDKRFPVMPPN